MVFYGGCTPSLFFWLAARAFGKRFLLYSSSIGIFGHDGRHRQRAAGTDLALAAVDGYQRGGLAALRMRPPDIGTST
jgi:hypothetical protein